MLRPAARAQCTRCGALKVAKRERVGAGVGERLGALEDQSRINRGSIEDQSRSARGALVRCGPDETFAPPSRPIHIRGMRFRK